MVLDIDETFDEVHGDQQLSLFNGYYGGLSISIPMTEEEMSPLRKRMTEDMRIREMRNKGKIPISGRSRISLHSLAIHRMPRPRRSCAPTSFT